MGDALESQNIEHVFGQKTPLVTALKSLTGHELWMSGAAQVAYGVTMANEGFIAPTLNFENPDEYSSKLNIVSNRLEYAPRHMLCNSAGFGGTNATMVLRFSC